MTVETPLRGIHLVSKPKNAAPGLRDVWANMVVNPAIFDDVDGSKEMIQKGLRNRRDGMIATAGYDPTSIEWDETWHLGEMDPVRGFIQNDAAVKLDW